MPLNLTRIRDGYTRTSTFGPRFGWPAVCIEYRPALPERVYDYQKSRRDTGKETMRAVAELLVEHLKKWDIEEESGAGTQRLATISEENLRLLPHPILDWMVDCVTGYSAAEAAADVKN